MAGRVEIVPWQESPVLRKKWRECVTASDNFRACLQMPEWVDYRWRPFTKTFVATLHDSQSSDLVAVTPLVESEYQLRLSSAGWEFGTFRFNGLLLNGNVPLFPHSDECYEALCHAALAMPSVDCLYMLGVPKTSPFWSFLTRARDAHPQWLFYTPQIEFSRYLYIDMSMSYDEYLSKFKSKTLQTFRRKLRLLEKEGGGKLELLRVRSAEEVFQFLDALHALAKITWQRHLIDLKVDEPARRQELLESMARQGVLRSYLLRSGERVIAFLVGFQLNGLFYFHETGFDPAYARFSPGLTLLNLIIKDCFEVEKPNLFHFGMGESYYKNLLANRNGEEVAIMILRNSGANRAKVTAHRLFRKSIELIKSAMVRKVPATQEP